MNDTFLLLLLLVFVIYYYFIQKEHLTEVDDSRNCSKSAINTALYTHQINMINRGAR